MQVAAFAVLSSVSSKEKMLIALQRKWVSTYADIMDGGDVACKNVTLETFKKWSQKYSQ